MSSRKGHHLLDINVLIALVFEDHVHHIAVKGWFNSDPVWTLCPFTEAGFLRFATDSLRGGLGIREATGILDKLAAQPGYRYISASSDWSTLTRPFLNRLHGHNQVTDAFLLGLAFQADLILTTFDRALLHLAGEHAAHVRLLGK